jgi:hypothetical protein
MTYDSNIDCFSGVLLYRTWAEYIY